MNKNIKEQDFFTREAKVVAEDLLGKYICCKNGNKKFLIVETEAYYHNEKYENGKHICYGADKKKDEARNDVTSPLFERPGTWCIYHGQLLLSVTNDEFPDNVLIKMVKNEAGEILGPDQMAYSMCLYKTKPGYCDCHGQYSLSKNSNLYLVDGQRVSKIENFKRINIENDSEYRFKISW